MITCDYPDETNSNKNIWNLLFLVIGAKLLKDKECIKSTNWSKLRSHLQDYAYLGREYILYLYNFNMRFSIGFNE